MPKNTIQPEGSQHVESLRALALEQLRFPPSGGSGPKLENLMTGTRDVTLDDKGRLYIPSSFREQLDSTSPVYVFAPAGQPGLWIFSEKEWKGLTDTALEHARRPLNKADPIETLTLLLNRSERVQPDGHHRIQISPELMQASGLRKRADAIVVGSGNFLEVRPVGSGK